MDSSSSEFSSGKIKELYEGLYGADPQVERLPGAGSERVYFRVTSSSGPAVIATEGYDVVENKAFIRLAGFLRNEGHNVPEILAVSDDFTTYLQTDLGDVSLLSQLSTDKRMVLAEKALRLLANLQTLPEQGWEALVMCRPFSRRLVLWDLNYFKYEFLKPAGIAFDEERLEDDFEKLSDSLMKVDQNQWGLMYRDFQSRNIMVGKDESLWMIDFQGARKGLMLYDAVSFLWQAKAAFTPEERKSLVESYIDELALRRGIDKKETYRLLGLVKLLRTLQVLGAYGFRGLMEKKAHFIESIPGAIENLRELYSEGGLNGFPELKRIAEKCFKSRFVDRNNPEGLTVKIFSFSYKKGYPEDLSGNGGGFMFDCRGMHNPGRYDEYKPLTGLDKPVRDFLESRGEVQEFIRKSVDLVSPSVERYHERGFRSLQVGFGCTGGRHRSVYCAQAAAEALSQKYPEVRIELFHREQNIVEVFEKGRKV